MVTDPADYRWSSFPHHGLGRVDPLVSGFPEWEELGATEAERRRRWRARVRGVQDEAELAAVRTSLRSGRPLGTDDWTGRVAERLNIDLKPRPADVLPRKNELRPILTAKELDRVRVSIERGRPYGGEDWVRQTVTDLGLERTVRPEGRPRKVSQ
jgi:hypothetical protein